MRFFRHRTLYYVSLGKFKKLSHGGWRNYVATPSLARAKRLAKKLTRKYRQIDVRTRGKKAYVLPGSWL